MSMTNTQFDGDTHDPEHDHKRLASQLQRVRGLMVDQRWRTLEEIGNATAAPPRSVSARLRDLRKAKFGAMMVERRERGDRADGVFEYRLQPHTDPFAPTTVLTTRLSRAQLERRVAELEREVEVQARELVKLRTQGQLALL